MAKIRIFFSRLRAIELQLLMTVLLLFAAGYLLVVAAIRTEELDVTVNGVADILWPSVLPFILFLGVSIGLSVYVPRADQLILPIVALLAGMGLLLTARLEPSLALIEEGYARIDAKQSLWVTLGIGILAVILFAPLNALFRRYQRTSFMDWLNHHRYVWLVAGVGLLLATFVFGVDPNGSGVRAWFNLGLFYFQPSELLKVVLVIFMASYLDEHRELVTRSYQLGPLRVPPLPYLVPMIGMWGLCMGLIVVQRDLGAALLLFCVFLSMLYVATSSGLYIGAALAAFAGGSYLLYSIVTIVQTRVTIWLDPWLTAQTTGYQPIQAIYALASGGVFGSGLGFGYPTVVPATHTDFIFTALGEELGLVGTVGVLTAYLLLIARGLHIGLRMAGRFRGFEQLMVVGLTTILAMQTFIIVGGNLRVIPLTGITLPFMSYGGSSVLMNFLIIGLLLRISAGEEAG
jgi:cell division protein FtsW (lipid II flippase)